MKLYLDNDLFGHLKIYSYTKNILNLSLVKMLSEYKTLCANVLATTIAFCRWGGVGGEGVTKICARGLDVSE